MVERQALTEQVRYQQVRWVLLVVLVANLAVTVLKIALGIFTGALAVVADGFHSLIDSSSNLIGLAAIAFAARPADENHPYGYQRYETLGALAIGVLMLTAAWEIIKAIYERVVSGGQAELTLLTVGLVALTLPFNLLIVYLETRAGKRLKSDILLADAAHTRTDLFVSLSVLVSLVGVWLGLAWLDMVVAAGVVVLIVRAAIEILGRAARVLTDASAADSAQIERTARSVPGVEHVHRVRSRGADGSAFVDLHVKVHPGMSTLQAHAVATAVEDKLKAEVMGVRDAVVHIEPARDPQAGHWQHMLYHLRQVADEMGLGIHEMSAHDAGDGAFAIELHLEVPGEVSLVEAHRLADDFEARAREVLPEAQSLNTHLEPMNAEVFEDCEPDPGLEAQLKRELATYGAAVDLVAIQVRQARGMPTVAITLQMSPSLPLEAAHDRAEEIERDLLTAFPVLGRVTVHVEPRPN